MEVTETTLPGVLLIDPMIHRDKRGYFQETFQESRYHDAGIDHKFVQANMSGSVKGVLRGLHFQRNNPQGKLVFCTNGTVYDVAVDYDPNSNTFGRYFGAVLSESNHRQLWIPPGYAHGFCVLSSFACFQYFCTAYFDIRDEGGIRWDDPDVGIDWPINNPDVSEKDSMLPLLRELF